MRLCLNGSRLQPDLLDVFRMRRPRYDSVRLFRKDFVVTHRLLLPVFCKTGSGAVEQVFLALFGLKEA